MYLTYLVQYSYYYKHLNIAFKLWQLMHSRSKCFFSSSVLIIEVICLSHKEGWDENTNYSHLYWNKSACFKMQNLFLYAVFPADNRHFSIRFCYWIECFIQYFGYDSLIPVYNCNVWMTAENAHCHLHILFLMLIIQSCKIMPCIFSLFVGVGVLHDWCTTDRTQRLQIEYYFQDFLLYHVTKLTKISDMLFDWYLFRISLFNKSIFHVFCEQ
jgi:hypothetical protein